MVGIGVVKAHSKPKRKLNKLGEPHMPLGTKVRKNDYPRKAPDPSVAV